MTRLLVIVLAALLVAAPAAGAKKPVKSHGPGAKACKVSAKHGKKARAAKSCARKDAASASRRCRAERRDLGEAAFRARYGGKRRAFGRCVSTHARSGKGGRRLGEGGTAQRDEDLDGAGGLDEAEAEDEALEDDLAGEDDRDAAEPVEDGEELDAPEEDVER